MKPLPEDLDEAIRIQKLPRTREEKIKIAQEIAQRGLRKESYQCGKAIFRSYCRKGD